MRFVPTVIVYAPVHLAAGLPVGPQLLWVIPIVVLLTVMAAGFSMFVAAAHAETVIWVDSRMRAEHFRGAIVKPNRDEAEAACARALGRVDYEAFRRHLEAPLLVVTHGAKGAMVVSERGSEWVGARPVEHPVDICGAGDSFSAGAALTLRVTRDATAAARMGNRVASITIMKKGTGTASPAEVLEAAGA